MIRAFRRSFVGIYGWHFLSAVMQRGVVTMDNICQHTMRRWAYSKMSTTLHPSPLFQHQSLNFPPLSCYLKHYLITLLFLFYCKHYLQVDKSLLVIVWNGIHLLEWGSLLLENAPISHFIVTKVFFSKESLLLKL